MLAEHVRNSTVRRRVIHATGLVVCGALAVGASTAPLPQQQAPDPADDRPVFRAGVDAIPLDVTVLDGSRRPVRGLTAEDFIVLEDGQPQPIVSFGEIVVPQPVEPTAAWMRDVASDVVANDAETRRLVVIVMDDGYTGVELGEPRSVRLVAHAILDELGPSDMAAVVYTFMGRTENFTADRAKLRAAIEAFSPKNWGGGGVPLGCALRVGGCAVNALTRVAEVLATAPPGRKLVMFISPGVSLGRELAVNPDSFSPLDGLREMFQDLQTANATVYGFDPRGLMVGAKVGGEVALAEATGGRTIRNTNDPEWHVPDVFRENGSYYLIGYQSTHTRTDGRFRRISVRVNRPDVTVQTRNGYFGPRATRARASNRPAPSAIDTAIGHGLPGGDLVFRVSTAVFALPGRREAEVVAAVGVPPCVATEDAGEPPATPRTCQVELAMAAFDTGWRSRGIQRQTLELTVPPGSDRDVDVFARLRLAPGRYEVRLAAGSAGRSGRVFVNIDVPDFAEAALSLSDIIVWLAPAARDEGDHPLSDLVPVAPSVARTFTASDRPTAFLRVYQDRRRPPSPVTLAMTITNDQDVVIVADTVAVDPDRFAPDRSVDHSVALPLASLRPGEYLLSLVASAGTRQVTRRLRFTVEPR